MESNKIFRIAEDICLSGKDALENAGAAIDQGRPVSRTDDLDQAEIERLAKILKGVIREYRESA